jgi:acyl-CoA hydrolase
VVASKQGTAAIWGHYAACQADQIIGQVAHPSVRDELREVGRDLGFRLPESQGALPESRE